MSCRCKDGTTNPIPIQLADLLASTFVQIVKLYVYRSRRNRQLKSNSDRVDEWVKWDSVDKR